MPCAARVRGGCVRAKLVDGWICTQYDEVEAGMAELMALPGTPLRGSGSYR